MSYGKIAGHLLALHHLKMSQFLSRLWGGVQIIQNGVDTDIFYPAVNDRLEEYLSHIKHRCDSLI